MKIHATPAYRRKKKENEDDKVPLRSKKIGNNGVGKKWQSLGKRVLDARSLRECLGRLGWPGNKKEKAVPGKKEKRAKNGARSHRI